LLQTTPYRKRPLDNRSLVIRMTQINNHLKIVLIKLDLRFNQTLKLLQLRRREAERLHHAKVSKMRANVTKSPQQERKQQLPRQSPQPAEKARQRTWQNTP
jgi:hypothetical protein